SFHRSNSDTLTSRPSGQVWVWSRPRRVGSSGDASYPSMASMPETSSAGVDGSTGVPQPASTPKVAKIRGMDTVVSSKSSMVSSRQYSGEKARGHQLFCGNPWPATVNQVVPPPGSRAAGPPLIQGSRLHDQPLPVAEQESCSFAVHGHLEAVPVGTAELLPFVA